MHESDSFIVTSALSDNILILFDVCHVLQPRIKKIMQADEDVGKIALAVPVLVCEFSTLFNLPFILLYSYLTLSNLLVFGLEAHNYFRYKLHSFLPLRVK